jgi:hypothetical protein
MRRNRRDGLVSEQQEDAIAKTLKMINSADGYEISWWCSHTTCARVMMRGVLVWAIRSIGKVYTIPL